MMSSTTASKLPVRAARSADWPSPTATTSMPSAVSPRATAVRTPGSSSTTSTRAIRGNLPPPGHAAPGSELSQHVCVTLCPWQDAGRFASPRPSASVGAVGLGLARGRGRCVRPAAVAAGRARGPGELGAHRRRPGPVQRHGRAEQQPRAPRAAAGAPGRERHEHRPDLVRRRPPGPGGSCRPTPASAPWSPTARPTGRGTPTTARWSSAPQATSRTAPPRPTPRPPRRRRSPSCGPPAPSPSTAPRRWPVAAPTSWCSPPPRPSARCCARCAWRSTREKRMPLRLTVLATGSSEPALQVGFTDLTFGPQDPARFTFTPPPGATVTDAPRARRAAASAPRRTTVGDGWDTVKIMRRPADTTPATTAPRTPPTCPRSARRSAGPGAADG